MSRYAFQLTASRGGWQYCMSLQECHFYFNSQPHEEADETPNGYVLGKINISTHSLTRRLTQRICHGITPFSFQLTASRGGWRYSEKEYYKAISISTHSLTRRLTAIVLLVKNWDTVFQLTASRGGWRQLINCEKQNSNISTHSLTRRLTKFGIYCGYYWYNFNSQPHEEADGVLQDTHHSPTFISTHSLTRRLTEETTL